MLSQTLSLDEHLRAERFHFEKDRKHFIVSRGILRTIFGCYLNIEPNQLQFCYGKNGKPALVDTFDNGIIHFNLSCSDGLGLFAFTQDHEIGVDIERIHDIPEMAQIAKQFFSINENDVFVSLPENRKKETFFKFWTCKEAFIKATGDGLSRPLDKFDVSLIQGKPDKLLRIEGDSKEVRYWSIQELEPAFGFAAALAIEGQGWCFHCWQWLG